MLVNAELLRILIGLRVCELAERPAVKEEDRILNVSSQ